MVFTYLITNTDVWFKASTEKYDNEYSTYIYVYLDEILVLDKDTFKFMSMLMEK